MSQSKQQLYILYSGNLPEKIKKLQAHFSHDGLLDIDVSDVVGAAVKAFALDMSRLSAGDWQALVNEYKRLRKLVPSPAERQTRHAGEIGAYIKDDSLVAIDQIYTYALARELAPVKYASDRPVNRKLIVCIAVLYLYNKLIGEGE